MITFLEGILEESWPGRLVVNVSGVGYEITVPVFGDEQFGQSGEKIRILTHHHIREQEQTLYGFPDDEARDLFRLLILHVSGIGPKMAMAVLSGMAASDFKESVVKGDATTLAKIRGLGKKTAERIILELGDKVGVKDAWRAQSARATLAPEAAAKNDALLALISLGYKQTDAQKAISQIPTDILKPDEMLRVALRLLQR